MTTMVGLPAELARRRDALACLLLSVNIIAVAGTGIACFYISNPIAWVIGFILVGARGQACYILQHEAMHNLLFTSNKANSRVGVLLSAFLGTQFYFGRAFHMKHHRDIGSADDPNEFWHKTEGKEPKRNFILFMIFQLFGGRLILAQLSIAKSLLSAIGLHNLSAQLPGIEMGSVNVPQRYRQTDLLALLAMQVAMLLLISLASRWWVYILMYVLPLSTLTALFEAIRSFSEHVVPGPATNPAEKNRRFFMNGWSIERFFISQFDFHYHHIHHVYPNVPTFNVRRAHNWLIENSPGFRDTYIERPGYVGTAFFYLIERPIPGSGLREKTS